MSEKNRKPLLMLPMNVYLKDVLDNLVVADAGKVIEPPATRPAATIETDTFGVSSTTII